MNLVYKYTTVKSRNGKRSHVVNYYIMFFLQSLVSSNNLHTESLRLFKLSSFREAQMKNEKSEIRVVMATISITTMNKYLFFGNLKNRSSDFQKS